MKVLIQFIYALLTFLRCEMAENALNSDKNVLLEKLICISYLETGKGKYIPLEDTENTTKALFGLYESAKDNKRVFI